MDFDYMLTRVGEFGKYQKLLFVFQAPFAIFVTFVLFGQIFITIYPDVAWCGALRLDDQNNECHQLTDLQRSRLTSPMDNMCQRYNVPRSLFQQFMGQMNRACNTSGGGECIQQRDLRTRLARQTSTRYGQWNNGIKEMPPSQEPAPSGSSYNNRPPGSFGYNPPSKSSPAASGRPQSSTPPPGPNRPRPTSQMSSAQLGAFDDEGYLNCRSNATPIITLSMNPTTGLNTTNLQWPSGLSPCGDLWTHSEFNFSTVVTEAGYWCGTLPSISIEWKVTIAQSVFYIGAIVGGLLIGYIADNYGRVPALIAANVCGCVGGVLTIMTTNFWAFCFFRFIAGLSFDNCFTMIYILVLEYVGPSYRTLVANLSIAIFYTIGSVMIPGLFVIIGDWRWFGFILSLPMLLAILAYCIVPESARWLLSKGRTKEATNILRDFAKKNGKSVEEEVFVEFEKVAQEAYNEFKEEQEISLIEALKRPRILKNFVLLVLIWALIALIYDGHSRNVLNLGSNFFVMFAVASSLEFPADLLLVFILDVFGRRWLAFASLFTAASFSLISAIPTIASDPSVLLVFALLSRFFVNIAFNIGLQYAAEILPTVIRAQGVNFIHIMGYVFSILSPFIASIGRTNPSVSLSILGMCALVAAILCLFLPETVGEDLPNSLDDGESFGSKQSFWNCPLCAKGPEAEETTPITQQDDRVRQRNSLRASLRGEALRSSIIYRTPNPALDPRSSSKEGVKLRRVYTR